MVIDSDMVGIIDLILQITLKNLLLKRLKNHVQFI